MKRFETIVVPLNLSMPPYWIGRTVSNALYLTDWLEGRLYVTSDFELEHLRPTLEELRADLVYLTAGYKMSSNESELISGITLPIFLARPGLKLSRDPFTSLLVPLGDDRSRSTALDLGLDVAEQLDLPVDIIHVTQERCRPVEGLSALVRMSDQFEHEYPQALEEFVARCSPFASLGKRKQIRNFGHICGEIDREVIESIRRDDQRMVILDWKGSLRAGHAKTVKSVLAETHSPILLVRSAAKAETTLKAGRNFRAA